jgi:plasmid maintenance system antidote protein VapI
MTIQQVLGALRSEVCRRMANGESTERSLAGRVGVSQPQIHNVLKGARKLTPELADRILQVLGISVLDLF